MKQINWILESSVPGFLGFAKKKLVHYNVGVSVGMVQRLLYQQPCLMACPDFENYESLPALKYNVLFLG